MIADSARHLVRAGRQTRARLPGVLESGADDRVAGAPAQGRGTRAAAGTVSLRQDARAVRLQLPAGDRPQADPRTGGARRPPTRRESNPALAAPHPPNHTSGWSP